MSVDFLTFYQRRFLTEIFITLQFPYDFFDLGAFGRTINSQVYYP